MCMLSAHTNAINSLEGFHDTAFTRSVMAASIWSLKLPLIQIRNTKPSIAIWSIKAKHDGSAVHVFHQASWYVLQFVPIRCLVQFMAGEQGCNMIDLHITHRMSESLERHVQ